jgi:hypothetical protein
MIHPHPDLLPLRGEETKAGENSDKNRLTKLVQVFYYTINHMKRSLKMWKVDKGSLTGVTTSEYVNVLDWKTAELGEKTILLKNTDASQSLKYKLLAFAVEGGNGKEVAAETILAPGETAEFHYSRQWDKLELMAASGSGAASYQIDYEGQGA